MIYYYDELVDWKTGESEQEVKVREEINTIKEKYFGEKTTGVVSLIYPKGAPDPDHRVFGVLKKFPVSLKSYDGSWRYSKGRPKKSQSGITTYSDNGHFLVTYSTDFRKGDEELLWFLLNRSSSLNSGKVYLEDKEEEAKIEVNTIATDADIRYDIMGNKSVIAKNEKLIREVADVFGVKDVEKHGINQVKLALFNTLKEGQKNKDRFTNYARFEELTQGDTKRKAAYYARRSIADKEVIYKDRGWWIADGGVAAEKLMNVSSKDAPYKEQAFIDEIVNNANVRSRLFDAIGQDETITITDLRALDRPVLMRKYTDVTGNKSTNSDSKEDLVKKLCDYYKIEYTKKSS